MAAETPAGGCTRSVSSVLAVLGANGFTGPLLKFTTLTARARLVLRVRSLRLILFSHAKDLSERTYGSHAIVKGVKHRVDKINGLQRNHSVYIKPKNEYARRFDQ